MRSEGRMVRVKLARMKIVNITVSIDKLHLTRSNLKVKRVHSKIKLRCLVQYQVSTR
jgi:hypothetical protein